MANLVAGVVEAVRLGVLIGVVLIGVLVLLVVLFIHATSTLLGFFMGPDLIVLVHAMGLGELVDLSTDESSEEFLSKGVVDCLA